MTRRTGAKPLTNQFAGNGKVTDEMSVTLFYWPRCSAVAPVFFNIFPKEVSHF